MLALVCITVIINNTKIWSKHDKGVLTKAKFRCSQIYPDNPCLKKFIKVEEHRYKAVCGKLAQK